MCKFLANMSSRTFLWSILLISIAVGGAGYILEHFYGFQPCQLCLYEQKVFKITAIIALVGLFLPLRWKYYFSILLGLCFLVGAAIAGYHVAVQHHLVELPAFCASQDFSAFESIEALKEQMLKTPFVRCDQITWSLFGLSLAAYNAILSLILTLFCLKWACKHR